MDVTFKLTDDESREMLRQALVRGLVVQAPPASAAQPAANPNAQAFIVGVIGEGGVITDLLGVFDDSNDASRARTGLTKSFVFPVPINRLADHKVPLEGLSVQ